MTTPVSRPAARPCLRRTGVLAAALALLLAAAGRLPRRTRTRWSPRSTASKSTRAISPSPRRKPASFRRCRRTPRRTIWSQFMADMILVSKAAEDQEAGRQPRVQAQELAFARKKLLMAELLQSVGKEALTDEAMHKVYDDAVKQMRREEGSACAPHPDPRRARRRKGRARRPRTRSRRSSRA